MTESVRPYGIFPEGNPANGFTLVESRGPGYERFISYTERDLFPFGENSVEWVKSESGHDRRELFKEFNIVTGANVARYSETGGVICYVPQYRVRCGKQWSMGHELSNVPPDENYQGSMFIRIAVPVAKPGLTNQAFTLVSIGYKEGQLNNMFITNRHTRLFRAPGDSEDTGTILFRKKDKEFRGNPIYKIFFDHGTEIDIVALGRIKRKTYPVNNKCKVRLDLSKKNLVVERGADLMITTPVTFDTSSYDAVAHSDRWQDIFDMFPVRLISPFVKTS